MVAPYIGLEEAMVVNEAKDTKIPDLIGASVKRLDVEEKVTGAAVFTDDFQFGPGLLYARIKRSPHPHALIKSIDTSKAEKLPGVKAVVTGADYPGYIGLYLKDGTSSAATGFVMWVIR